jgi:hypothetical protein
MDPDSDLDGDSDPDTDSDPDPDADTEPAIIFVSDLQVVCSLLLEGIFTSIFKDKKS